MWAGKQACLQAPALPFLSNELRLGSVSHINPLLIPAAFGQTILSMPVEHSRKETSLSVPELRLPQSIQTWRYGPSTSYSLPANRSPDGRYLTAFSVLLLRLLVGRSLLAIQV